MKKTQILIDLSILKTPYCGLGQIACNYCAYYKAHLTGEESVEYTFLVPKAFFGVAGPHAKYIESKHIYRILKCLLPYFDVWHAIHQLSHYSPWNARTKYLLTIHDFNYMYEKTGSKIQKYQRKIQHKVDRANRIVCISHFAKSETERFVDLKGKQVDVIYNGIQCLDEHKALKPVFSDENHPFFFTIGEVKEKKNFAVLLDMMKHFPEYELYIAGNNATDYASYLTQRIVNEHIDNVHLVGFVTNEERIWLYAHCIAFFFPSLFEGFGLPVIEAMQFGKPVFSSQETSLKEIGGPYAFFWPDFEACNMAKIVRHGLETVTHERMETEKEYAASFTYDKHIQAYWHEYEKLAQ